MKLNEREIKARVLSYLLSTGRMKRGALLANEFVIAGSSVRADLAILGDRFIGIEVKSDRDSLKRLNAQVAGYLSCFDSVILVLAERHLKSLPSNSYPEAEVLQINQAGSISLISSSTRVSNLKSYSRFNMLTQVEQRRHFDFELKEILSSSENTTICEQQICNAFRVAFSDRFKATSREFWTHIGRRKVRAEDLEILSRSRGQREATKRWQHEREQQNQNWISKLHKWQSSHAEIA